MNNCVLLKVSLRLEDNFSSRRKRWIEKKELHTPAQSSADAASSPGDDKVSKKQKHKKDGKKKKSKKRKHSRDSSAEKSPEPKRPTMEELRAARVKREAAERHRSIELVSRLQGYSTPARSVIDERTLKYNTVYWPKGKRSN